MKRCAPTLCLIVLTLVCGPALSSAMELAPWEDPQIVTSETRSLSTDTTAERESAEPVTEQTVRQAIPPPRDPCLPPLYRTWRELGDSESPDPKGPRYDRARIIIDRSRFILALQGVRKDGSVKDVYVTSVALGEHATPTPVGRFFINHIYCYPDVLFFAENGARVPAVYDGFFTPILACGPDGACERFRELGIHGFNGTAFPNPALVRHETRGPVSSGCIRVPDPCRFKTELVRLVGVGPLERNDRGCYHWLEEPVDVLIVDEETTILSLIGDGIRSLHDGVSGLFGFLFR